MAEGELSEDRRQLLQAVQGPLNSAKDLTDRMMGHGKDRDDCTPEELLARGVWHALHYLERYLTGWDRPADQAAWERTTDMFVKLALAARQRPTDPADGLTEDTFIDAAVAILQDRGWPVNRSDMGRVWDFLAARQRPTDPLAPERPRDINLVESRLRTRLHEHPEQSVVLTAEEARTLMRSISDAGRRLCSD